MVSCKEYVKERKELLREQVDTLHRDPKLCVIQIGEDPASTSYIKGKRKDCEEVGIAFEHIHIKDYRNFSESALINLICDRCYDTFTDGIILQLPIPDKYHVEYIQRFIGKSKDVDGFRRDSLYTPCTPKGIMDYLDYNGIRLEGKVCVVVGRSEIVGKPLVNLLIDRGATVVSCNSKTADLRKYTKTADIVISAIGRAEYFDSTYFTEGQILIDVGINRDAEGKLCGDIAEDAKSGALLATPVPSGVGLLTRLALLENTVEAFVTGN